MKSRYNRIIEKIERFKESPQKDIEIENLLIYLHKEEGLEYREAFDVCKFRLGNNFEEERFVDIALTLKVNELPLGGYLDEDGSTVIYGSEETC